jgi:hypothetical protein
MTMSLDDLLITISRAIESRPAEAALPCNLDEVILHQIARDLRLIGLPRTVDDSIEPPLVGPMYLIFHMTINQTERLKGKSKLEMSEERLQHWMQRYMHYTEREVVARALNMPNQRDTELFMAEIETEILASH